MRNSAVLDATTSDPSVQGIQRYFAVMAAESRVTATAIQTVGSKGYEGLSIALVTGT